MRAGAEQVHDECKKVAGTEIGMFTVTKARIVVLLAAALLVAACGTRLPDSAFVESQGSRDGSALDEFGTDDLDGGEGGSVDGGSAGGTTGGSAGRAGTTTGGTGGTGGTGTTGGGPGGPNQASDVGITPTSITLGTIVAENGVLGDAFAPAARGLRAWAAATNAKGGIRGRKIILKTCDDREDRSRALECARNLIEQEKVFMLVGTNTRAFGGAAEYINSQQVPVLGIPITNSFYRYPHLWSGYSNGYPRDGQNVGWKGKLVSLSGAYRWFKQNLGVSTAAVFAYDIDESRQAGGFIAKGLELEGFKVVQYAVSFAAPSFDGAVADMEDQNVEIVFDAMDDGANRKLCDAMSRRQFPLKAKVSTVVSMGDSIGKNYKPLCRDRVYITGSSRPFSATHIPSIANFSNAFKKYQPGQAFHQWALEAWGQAELVADAIESMGPAPTRKGVEDYFRNLKGYTADGMFTGLDWQPVNYDAPRNEHCFTIAKWNNSINGWSEATQAFPFCVPDAHQYHTDVLEQGN